MQVHDFETWRQHARNLLAAGIPPEEVIWEENNLFSGVKTISESHEILRYTKVPKQFMQLAERVACHSDNEKWNLLYIALWRLSHGEKHLLKLSTDPVVQRLNLMNKSIGFDAHKTKAFVRFRKCMDEQGEIYLAWHNPDHMVLKLVAPFFSRRFNDMRWTIFTSRESATWDEKNLNYGKGIPASEAPSPDQLEDLWKDYYRATFNPARIKIKAMKKEMPVRHWKTLPETAIIAEMLGEAPKRVEKMIEKARENLG